MSSKPMGLKILAVIVIAAAVLSGCAPAADVASPTAAPTTAPTTAPTVDQAPTLSQMGTQVAQTFAANLALTVPPATPVPPAATLAPTSTPVTLPATSTPEPLVLPATNLAGATQAPYYTPTLTTYSCGLISVSPKSSDKIKAGTSFTASWRVENTGSEYWQATEVDIHYVSGTKLQVKAADDVKDLDRTVGPTGSYTLNIDMKAPALAGPYTTQWAIKYGQINICTLNLTLHVVN